MESGLAEESFDWPSFETPIDPSELLPGAFFILWVKRKIVQVRKFNEKKNWKLQLCDEEPSMEFHQPVLMQVFQSEAMKKIPKFPISPSNKGKKPIGFPRSSFLFFLFCPLT